MKTDLYGTEIWSRVYGGPQNDEAFSVQPTYDGGYIIAGHSGSSSTGDVTGINHGLTDYWVIRLDAAGNIIYQ